MGGDLEGTVGTVPQNLRWGTAHVSVPQYFEKHTVIGCEANYELTKKRCQGEISCSEIKVFGHKSYIRFQTAETDKIESMTKKEVVRNNSRW